MSSVDQAIEVVGAESEKHAKQMEDLARFCGAHKISYDDKGQVEVYTLVKPNRQRLILKSCANQVDGAFLVVQTDYLP